MLRRSASWFAFIVLFGTRAFAQTASISGTVLRDSSSQGMPGVSVALLGVNRTVGRTVETPHSQSLSLQTADAFGNAGASIEVYQVDHRHLHADHAGGPGMRP